LIPRRERQGLPVESVLAAVALVLAAALPVLEIGLRTFLGTGLPGNSGYVQHLALWIGCLGVSRAVSWPEGLRAYAGGYVALVSTAVAGGLAWAGVQFVLAEFDAPARIGGWLPVWIAEAVIPAGFAGVTVIFVARAGAWRERALAVLGLVLAASASLSRRCPPWPCGSAWPP
jgi:TRAP-type C4-dicarboxylate transport system permease small subunit